MRACDKRSENPITVDTPELMRMLHTGYQSAIKIGDAAGARIKIGRLVRWNVNKITAYIDRVSE
jgi:hypothetical protein